MFLAPICFYVFSAVAIFCGLRVISSRQPVHSVLFLILAFFNVAGLFVLLGAEFLAMILVVVYVGAVAVLFLFVVMMLDVDVVAVRSHFWKHLPIGIIVGLVLLAELVLISTNQFSGSGTALPQGVGGASPTDVENTRAIGDVLYTEFIVPFQLAGLILLVAMIGAIVLTLRRRPGVLRQTVAAQVARSRKDVIEVRSVEQGKGQE